MNEIDVKIAEGSDKGWAFNVRVREHGAVQNYFVTLERLYYKKLSSGVHTPVEFIQKCFEFLLERESKDSILKKFDISEIGIYFKEFEDQIGK